MRLKFILVGILLHTALGCVLSQNSEIQFHKVIGENGQPLGKITAITQDLQGYMWFSGQSQNCLYRYDGLHLKLFVHDNLDDNTPGGLDIETIFSDDQGLIWIGYNDAGLDKFDPATLTFTHFRHNPNDSTSLGSDGVHVIFSDGQRRLWVGTSNGLDRLEEATGKFLHYRKEQNNPRSLSDNIVRTIYEDRQGTIWVGTGYPFAGDPTTGGLNRLETDGSFTRFMHDPNDPHSLINNKVRSIFEDSRGVFWIGTSGDGLHTLDRKTGRFERHTYDPANPNKLSRPVVKGSTVYSYFDPITFIKEDQYGFIWIGTMEAGIVRYDPITKQKDHYHTDTNLGFPDKGGWALYQSRDSTIWLSTEENNLFHVEFPQRKISDTKLGTCIYEFLEYKNGMLWIGGCSGLMLFDRERHLVQRFGPEFFQPSNFILEMFQNQEDTLWLGTLDGFGTFHIPTKNYSKILGFSLENEEWGAINNMIQDHLGYIWITTARGLLRINPKDKSVKRFHTDKDIAGSISSDQVIDVIEDESGTIWAGTNAGLNKFDRKTEKFKTYLSSSREAHLYIKRDGSRWLGTRGGLYRYNEETDAFDSFGDGTVVSRGRIYGMVEDSANNLWVTTPFTISKITAQRDEIFTYGSKFGIVNINPSSIYMTTKGEILLGHDLGYYTLNPETFGNDDQQFGIMISNVLINNRAFDGKEAELLTLKHDQNDLVFTFSSDDYRSPDGTQYFTMLEGYDNVWRNAASNRMSNFVNLAPGDYVYRVKALNASVGRAERSITIRIAPPWWKTWWAYSFYCLCGISLLWLGKREIVKRERLRSAFELEHLQLAKAQEIDRVKSAFFTNISHEFRTPLTLIKGPAQLLLKEYSDRPGAKKHIKLIQHNADVLLKHINQLLELAKLESGTEQVNEIRCDLNSFLNKTIDSFISYATQKEITFTYQVPGSRFYAIFDRGKVETIITNLLSNALKFTPVNGRVDLEAHVNIPGPASAGQLILKISDTGIGIPPQDQLKVFERFYQVNDGGAHKQVGTGIGLALVKELCELLGGIVELKSEPGNGSEFCVTLPLQMINLASETESHEQLQADEAYIDVELKDIDKNGNGKTKLLVVDDNAELRHFIISSLKGDYSFCEAEDGKQALEIALQEIPELVISDVMMPEMDGITMTGKLKKDIRTSHIPVILLTAKATDEAKITGLNTGADDYLIKPFNNEELLLKVRNMLESRTRVREKVRLELLREGPAVEVVSADEKLLQRVKQVILDRLSDGQLSVDSLAEEVGLSRAHFYRKVTALTNMSANDLIRSFRLQRAAQLLKQRWGPVTQVAYEVGFSNPSHFSKCFREEFGVSPSEYYQKDCP